MAESTENALINQLIDLTKRWNSYEDVPKSQQAECRKIGQQLHATGGEALMRAAYYSARDYNRDVHVIQAYWDGIGNWRW